MRIFFSGIRGMEDLTFLESRRADSIFLHPRQIHMAYQWHGQYILDFLRPPSRPDHHIHMAHMQGHQPEFIMAPWHSDPRLSMHLWMQVRNMDDRLIPTWHWNSPLEYLRFYLAEVELVAIDGCQSWMAQKDRRSLDRLLTIVEMNPGRCHITNASWAYSITEFEPFVYSISNVQWRDTTIAYKVDETRLTQGPARLLYPDTPPSAIPLVSVNTLHEWSLRTG